MSNGIVIKIAGTLSLLFLFTGEVFPQFADGQTVKIMFYNVENLFDIYDDTATDDNEFLPGSDRRWNFRRYERKIDALYKTITAAGEWSPPEVIGLCEVENRKVLEDLVYRTNLSKYNYDILHEDSPDPRGIDVSMIYRKDFIDIVNWSCFPLESVNGSEVATRSIMYVKFLAGGDTIHLFINHWPSRRGGVLAGESLRESIAEMLRSKIDSLAFADGSHVKVIIMGDLNATPADDVVQRLSEPYRSGLTIVNFTGNHCNSKGTYRYRGIWEMIDQILVSGWLRDCTKGLCTDQGMFSVFEAGFLLKKDPVYPGLSPFSTYKGYSYQGGFSDHLPVMLLLKVR
jgi:predicted extracellular nuclease